MLNPDLLVLSATFYGNEVHAAIRGLWLGIFDEYDFYDAMSATIKLGLRKAWSEGAGEYGISMGELSQDERYALQSAILYEHQWIVGFADAIVAGNKASGGLLKTLFARAQPWINRYNAVRSQARVMAGKDQKLMWVLGPTKSTCSSCLRLAGKVKRASYWAMKGILPGVHGAWYLMCRGFGCKCQLKPTDKPLSKGPLPGLP